MDEKKLYEEEGYLENPNRRGFIKAIPMVAAAVYQITCKNTGPTAPPIPTPQPATEGEGRVAIRDAVTSVMQEKGYSFEIKEDVNFYTNKNGIYDIGVFIDKEGNGTIDLRFGLSYLTGSDQEQGLNNTGIYKFKEIRSGTSPLTDKSYLTDEFEKFIRDNV